MPTACFRLESGRVLVALHRAATFGHFRQPAIFIRSDLAMFFFRSSLRAAAGIRADGYAAFCC